MKATKVCHQPGCKGTRVWCAEGGVGEFRIKGPWFSGEHPSSYPVRRLFKHTGDTPWQLYQGLGMEGFTVPSGVVRDRAISDGEW